MLNVIMCYNIPRQCVIKCHSIILCYITTYRPMRHSCPRYITCLLVTAWNYIIKFISLYVLQLYTFRVVLPALDAQDPPESLDDREQPSHPNTCKFYTPTNQPLPGSPVPGVPRTCWSAENQNNRFLVTH